MLGLDYSGGRPGGAAIRAAGYDFVVRYLSKGGPALPGKLLTAAEYLDLMVHGVAVVVNWETTADRMRGGYQAGVIDAQRADAQVRAVGHPTARPILFSADWDATPGDQVAIDAYLRGAASVIGAARVGVYGSFYVVRRCLDNRTAAWAWQTGAWSGGQREPRAHLYQRIGTVTVGGVECDVNEALTVDFGQHPQEDDMPSPADLWNHLLDDPYVGPDGEPRDRKPAHVLVSYGAANAAYAVEQAGAARAEVAALRSALPDMIAEEIRSALAQGLVDVDITVTNKTEE